MTTAAFAGFSIFLIIAVAFVTFIVVRKALRLAIKLALISALFLTVALGAGVWWWKGGMSNDTPAKRSTTAPARRSAANR
ncbi:MAG: hypothetical protein MSG64_03225 [Pyrinomonadaceae bacterium MAG19_C2-C3]|nr:hypothetical protein [Pyrinomonadaceae bacterium MAG19_C2-C3]